MNLPTGTVTFLFTDIQGSTKLWQSNPAKMRKALVRHDEILHSVIEANRGWVFKTVGDAFCAAFDTAMEGLSAALDAQLAIRAEEWDLPQPMQVRMALHTGEAEERNRDYYGPALNRVARIESIGYGGQTLLSLVTAELVRDTLPEEVTLKDMGERRLKDLTRPEAVYQLLHPDLPVDFPPLKSLDIHPHNLPLEPTPLIGRERELESVQKMMIDAGVRVVTLTGPGGMGKTRLGLQVAAEMIEFFKDGAFFVDLAPVRDPELLISSIAQTLRIKETGGRFLLDTLKDYLRGKHMLLLLDNFEQIMKAELQVVQLLTSCGGLKILVTSREPLHVRGEKIFAVPSLSLPERIDKKLPSIEKLTQYEAVRLFIERAAALKQDFTITNNNAPAVAEICVRLEGIPLAIELAAARIVLLSPQAILKRLDNRLNLLTVGAHDLPARQQTLRATIDWSYELLDEKCRLFFRILSVFAGGFTIETAEAVCSGNRESNMDVLNGISSLIEKSLLFQEEAGEGEPRCYMLETLREYGLERLEQSGDADSIKKRHADYFCEIAREAWTCFDGPRIKQCLDRLEADHDNLREAMRWCELSEKTEMLLTFGNYLWRFWQLRGFLTEGQVRLESMSHIPGVSASSMGAGLMGAGALARDRGEYEAALKLLKAALSMYKNDGKAEKAQVYHELGWTYYRMELLDESRRQFMLGEAAISDNSGPLLHGMMEFGLGSVDWREKKWEQAIKRLIACHGVFSKRKAYRLMAQVLNTLGVIARYREDPVKAKGYYEKAVKICELIGDNNYLRNLYNNLGDVHFLMHDYQNSILYYHKLEKLVFDSGDMRMLSTAYAGLAETSLSMQNIELAKKYAKKANEAVKSIGASIEYGVCSRVLGEIYLSLMDPRQAIESFSSSIQSLENVNNDEELLKAKNGYERAIALLKEGEKNEI